MARLDRARWSRFAVAHRDVVHEKWVQTEDIEAQFPILRGYGRGLARCGHRGRDAGVARHRRSTWRRRALGLDAEARSIAAIVAT